MKYKTILSDPPWAESGGGKIKRGADRHYELMKTKDIIAMKDFVSSLTDTSGCHLYLWVTNNFLEDGLEVMKQWGFRYITKITWVKGEVVNGLLPDMNGLFKLQKFGLGQYFRGITEDCLFGSIGNHEYKITQEGKRAQGKTLIIEPRKEHSRKPETMRQMAELVSYPPRIELFARQETDGWYTWGNEANNNV